MKVRSADRALLYESTDTVHRWGSYVFLALLLATAVAWARARARRTGTGWGTNVALGVVAAAASACVVTGPDLRWNQLALWAVVAGSDIRGVVDLDGVKYVLVGGREVAFSTFNRTVWLHTAILPVLLAVAIGVVWFTARREGCRTPLTTARATETTTEVFA